MSGKLPLSLFDFELPAELIAQKPIEPRDSSRLLVLNRDSGECKHQAFTDLPEFLEPGDVLVVNKTQVIPARVLARKRTGGQVELLMHKPLDGTLADARRWICLGRPGRALKPGVVVLVGDEELTVVSRDGQFVCMEATGPMWPIVEKHGQVPLPPYIKRPEGPSIADAASYQTIFAREPGAVAAPTASLHFSEATVAALRERGVAVHPVVLHVGPGTFLPVADEASEDVRAHTMHSERYQVPDETAVAIGAAKERGRRVVAVGTTSVRAVETWATTGASSGESNLFIHPGYTFKIVDALVTNFHLPRSTLLILLSTFAGREAVLEAYRRAVEARYRFFSYGDAMLVM